MHGVFENVLPLVPLLLLVVSLLLGRYPGCDAVVRLSERIGAQQPRRRRAKAQPRPRAPRFHSVSGGLLIAFGLAQRPPPPALQS
jgi:hypothetical protein